MKATRISRALRRPGRDAAVPVISTRLLAVFRWYTRRYLARHFHTFRLARQERPGPVPFDLPLVVYLNHPSWWDPLAIIRLAEVLWPERRHYGPIEAEALARYPFLGRLGLFGIRRGTRGGAARFLRTAEAILAGPGTVLWITAEGRFTDPRTRPVRLEGGLGHLAARTSRALFLPLAIEYPFGEERTPEIVARFGRGVMLDEAWREGAGEWTALFQQRLEDAQNQLAKVVIAGEKRGFDDLVRGRVGVGGVYDFGRRLKALLSGHRFDPRHGKEAT